jgi:hypothetical protein
MELKGRIAVEDLMAAQWVHVRPKRSLAVVGILLLGVAVFAMADSFLGHRQSLTDPKTWILPGVLAYLAFIAFIWIPRKVRRSYFQRKDLHHDISMVVTNDGIASRSEQGYSMKPWSDYLKWKEGKSVFLLYLSDHMFQMIPKRFFAVHKDVDAFRSMVRQSIADKANTKA